MSHYWETEIPTVISMDLLLLEFCSGPIADESLHLLGKYSNVDVLKPYFTNKKKEKCKIYYLGKGDFVQRVSDSLLK